jgi:predicted dehydrogenase
MTRWSFDGAKKMSWTEELSVQKIGVENAVPFDLQLADFVAVIRGEAEPSCSGRAGLQALVVCDAVKRAMENGGVVEIPESRI